MINNVYRTPDADYALGGIINGVLDSLIITSLGKTDIFTIYCDDESSIALSSKYSLMVRNCDGDNPETMPVQYLNVGEKVVKSDGSSVRITRTELKLGNEIIIPKRLINLNGFLVVFHGG